MARKKKKKRHYCDGALCFHGAFNSRGDAQSKASKLRGAFVVKKFARWGRKLSTRFMVLTKDKSGVPF